MNKHIHNIILNYFSLKFNLYIYHFMKFFYSENRLINRKKALKPLLVNTKKLLNYSEILLENLFDELKSDKISKILVLGDRQNFAKQCIKQTFPKAEIDSLYFIDLHLTQNYYDLVVSFYDISTIKNLKEYLYIIMESLNSNGVVVGCFFGADSLINLRQLLWQIEETITNKYPLRINPMLKLKDLTGLIQNTGFKNIITFKDNIEINFENMLELIHNIRNFGENGIFEKTESFSKQVASLIKNDSKKFTEKFEILSFCASRSSELFTNQVNM